MNYNGIRLDFRVEQKKKKRPGGRKQIFPSNDRKCVYACFNSFEFIELFVVGGANKRQAESGSCNNTLFLDSTLF